MASEARMAPIDARIACHFLYQELIMPRVPLRDAEGDLAIGCGVREKQAGRVDGADDGTANDLPRDT